ncbi:MAG: hypothetical protein A3C90_01950 [Candidatus Magasanikbacteria bacterium RIFCSPHIGHO2_02_FULL_51_14]|uniref:Glycosyl transferase family 1 domain-containing protein n=1 Tax=Candidatus Magasanikbacteria bacterium RIFCSPHIGHO2_02_FULL_51_14 TaxID=1798683 RepID=A0A1F6MPL7_9BACT|nr:MAG: hypothetical protein A3C90_01950 [Candidatus Magasanikbacteria bacterium RIFCSPHIGHO2_02_FULL_51_14]
MKIGIDIRCLMNQHRTGVGEYTYELLNALFSIDRANQYFLFYNSYIDVSKYVRLWNQENVQYVETRWPNKIFSASQVLFGLPKLDHVVRHCEERVSERRGNLVDTRAGHCQGDRHDPIRIGSRDDSFVDVFFSPNLNFTSISRNVKHVLTIHDLSFEIVPDCYSPKQQLWHKIVNPKKQCERAGVILTPSENTRRDVVELYGVGEKKVCVLKPGLSANFLKLETGPTSSTDSVSVHRRNWKLGIKEKYDLPEKYILFLGTIEPRKNVLGVIKAFQRSSLIINHYSLIIAGPKGWKSGEILREIDGTDKIRYIGYVPAEDKPALYALADVFVYPSLYEGFGFPVLEAMASGTPVITSNRSSLPEVAGDAAYLVNPYNVAEIATAIERLATDKQLRDLFVERGKERAREFEWNETAKEFLEIIVMSKQKGVAYIE